MKEIQKKTTKKIEKPYIKCCLITTYLHRIVRWDQKDLIYDELLKPGKIVNTKYYEQEIIDLNQVLLKKRWEYKLILLHDNVPSYTAKPINKTFNRIYTYDFLIRFGSIRVLFLCI